MIAEINTTPLIYFERQQKHPRDTPTTDVREDFGTRPAAAEQPVQEPKPRAMRLERHLFVTPGFTRGCPGCITLDRDDGVRRGGHTDACRRRIEEHLMQSEEGQERMAKAATKKAEYREKVERMAGNGDGQGRLNVEQGAEGEQPEEPGQASGEHEEANVCAQDHERLPEA